MTRSNDRCARLVLLLLVLASTIGVSRGSAAGPLTTRLRRPVALQMTADERQLLVANRRSGSVSLIDLRSNQVKAELDVVRRLSDLQRVPGSDLFLATDESAHELLVLSLDADGLSVRQRLPVEPYPVAVVVSQNGRRAYVSCLWSRRIVFVNLVRADRPAEGRKGADAVGSDVSQRTLRAELRGRLDLPFAPRRQLLVEEDTRLLVADSFAGQLGVVDCDAQQLLSVREFPAHNIRGLGTSPDGTMLIISQQMLNEVAHTVQNDVHWGLLMSNDLRWLKLDAVLDPDAWLYEDAHMVALGDAGNAAADPAGVAVSADGTVVVALAGVGEVAFGRQRDLSMRRLEVGRRPTAVVVQAAGDRALVANTFSDSVSLVDLNRARVTTEITLGRQPPLSLVDRGEQLFFDARLSHDGWMSCHSCHTDGHSNGLLNDNLSDGSFGASKRVLSLLGVAGTGPFAWNGKTASFAEQIHNSVTQTMQRYNPPTDQQVAALTAYLRSLPAPPSIDVARGQQDPLAVDRGRKLFHARRCNTCHAPPTYTTPRAYSVGLSDEKGNDRFNPPSLVGVSQRRPYLHDGRAKSLGAVFTEVQHKVRPPLTDSELRDLLAFLRSL